MKSNYIKRMRECKGISQLELSYKARIAQGTLSALETGKLYPYSGWLKRIAEALDISEKELVSSRKEVE